MSGVVTAVFGGPAATVLGIGAVTAGVQAYSANKAQRAEKKGRAQAGEYISEAQERYEPYYDIGTQGFKDYASMIGDRPPMREMPKFGRPPTYNFPSVIGRPWMSGERMPSGKMPPPGMYPGGRPPMQQVGSMQQAGRPSVQQGDRSPWTPPMPISAGAPREERMSMGLDRRMATPGPGRDEYLQGRLSKEPWFQRAKLEKEAKLEKLMRSPWFQKANAMKDPKFRELMNSPKFQQMARNKE